MDIAELVFLLRIDHREQIFPVNQKEKWIRDDGIYYKEDSNSCVLYEIFSGEHRIPLPQHTGMSTVTIAVRGKGAELRIHVERFYGQELRILADHPVTVSGTIAGLRTLMLWNVVLETRIVTENLVEINTKNEDITVLGDRFSIWGSELYYHINGDLLFGPAEGESAMIIDYATIKGNEKYRREISRYGSIRSVLLHDYRYIFIEDTDFYPEPDEGKTIHIDLLKYSIGNNIIVCDEQSIIIHILFTTFGPKKKISSFTMQYYNRDEKQNISCKKLTKKWNEPQLFTKWFKYSKA